MKSLGRVFPVFFTLFFCADGLLGQPGQPAAVDSRVVREALTVSAPGGACSGPEPSLSVTVDPGFYVASTTIQSGGAEGYWEMSVEPQRDRSGGGFIFGGGVQERGLTPCFGAFLLNNRQEVLIQLNPRVLPGGNASQFSACARVLNSQRQQVGAERCSTSFIEFRLTLPADFYIIEVRSGGLSPRASIESLLGERNLPPGIIVGGFLSSQVPGFVAFSVAERQEVRMRAAGRNTFGEFAASCLQLTLYDALRNVIAQGRSQPGTVRVNPQDGLNYVWIPAGTYMMGCSPGDSECYGSESPSHSVTISKGFWMGQTEVTVGAYKRFAQATGRTMPSGPSWHPGWTQDNLPMVNVTWDDARSYCIWADGRLPTEAEWEYAARAGTQTKYYFGNDAGLLGDYAWYSSNSGYVAHPVGQKKPNAWGLFDMLGNVWEWFQDWYGSYPSQAVTDPQGPSSGSERALRGGSWVDDAWATRVSLRLRAVPGVRYDSDGFRCVRELIPESPASLSLQAVSLSQSSVTAETFVTGTVTLSGAAPAGGVAVTLQSSNSAARVPAMVTVAAGQTSATFTITIQAVSDAQNVTITASYGGVSKTAALTVNPAQGGSQPGTVRENSQDGLNHVWIPAGTYMMGCSPGDSECSDSEKPSHSVTISSGFWMGQTEVTVGAFKRLVAQATGRTMPFGPPWDSTWTQDNLPMVYVNWDDARRYCTWAGGRLPTEAEWEYAARAGTQTKYYFGNDAALLGDYVWYDSNSGWVNHPVGQKKPNAWGLYDMLGNVREWCQDWDGSYPSQAVADPQGPSSGSFRIVRGGSWFSLAGVPRVSLRVRLVPGNWHSDLGFRCVREVIP